MINCGRECFKESLCYTCKGFSEIFYRSIRCVAFAQFLCDDDDDDEFLLMMFLLSLIFMPAAFVLGGPKNNNV